MKTGHLSKQILAATLIILVAFGSFGHLQAFDKGSKMEAKQTLLGLDKEYMPGELIQIKVSPLPGSANTITAVYNFTLLENGKPSQSCEVLTKKEKNTDPKKSGSDFIFTMKCGGLAKYQVVFGVTYIETKSGTSEIISVESPELVIYDVKVSGVQPEPEPNVPDGNYGMIRAVYMEALKLKLDKPVKIALFGAMRNAFSGMSSKIAAGIYKDSTNEEEQADKINKFLMDSKEATTKAFDDAKVDNTTFDGNMDVVIKDKLKELFDKGQLRKFSEYQNLYAEISQGFDLALKNLQ